MRITVATLFVLALTACGGESTAQSPDFLFDMTRSDVQPLRTPAGDELGLVNRTHNVLWDYAHGYSRFGADHERIWGPVASFPAAELQSLSSTEDDLESASQAATRGAGRAGGAAVAVAVTETCVCEKYSSVDGTCIYLRCYYN